MIKKTDKKHHIENDEFEAGYNGQGPNPLYEPVPNFQLRPGDEIISPAIDNNTIIILGRDRDPFRETKEGVRERSANNPIDIETVSGYSDYMGAGAIDIIVGRGAPYAVPGVGSYPNSLPPLYLTKTDNNLRAVRLRDGEQHPGFVMDAARIYISQMCDIDEYFALKNTEAITVDQGPSSAIILKGDRLRMHSRRDIKIIAGGDKDTPTDSNGFSIRERGKIHLIAGNGRYGGQQPIPVGNNLVSCLNEIIDSIQAISTILENVIVAQKEVNAALKGHVHGTGTGPTTIPDPILSTYCLNADLGMMEDLRQLISEKTTNTLAIVNNYLSPAGSRYINSRYNTTT